MGTSVRIDEDKARFLENQREIFRTLNTVFTKFECEKLISFYLHIVEHQGLKGLYTFWSDVSMALKSMHGQASPKDPIHRISRRILIPMYNLGLLDKWKGFKGYFQRASLKKNGFALTMNVLSLKGLFTHPKPVAKDFIKLGQSLKRLSDPVADYFIDGTYLVKPGREADFIATSSLAGTFSRIKEIIQDEPYSWKLAEYPHDRRKVLSHVLPGKIITKSGYEVTPHDLKASALRLFPALIGREYEYFSYLLGPLPPQSLFEKADPKKDIAGIVSLLTKDNGDKLRDIYNGHPIAQLALAPVQYFGKMVNDLHPSSFCLDQDKGVERVRLLLERGFTLTSLDLSDATKNAPLSGAVGKLKALLPDHRFKDVLIRCFIAFSRMKFVSPQGVTLSHDKGGPMGMFGDYYWVLGTDLTNELELLGIPPELFGTIGDDLFFPVEYTSIVRQAFSNRGIPLSLGKSLFGLKIAEFAGRIITEKGPIGHFKANRYDPENPLVLTRRLGFKGLKKVDPSFTDPSLIEDLKACEFKKENKLSTPSPDRDPFHMGGYNIIQLYHMKRVSAEQKVVFSYLISLLYTSERLKSLDDILKRSLAFYKKKLVKVGNRWIPQEISESIVVGDYFPTRAKDIEGHYLLYNKAMGRPNVRDAIRDLLEIEMTLLHSRLRQEAYPEIPMLKPLFTTADRLFELRKRQEFHVGLQKLVDTVEVPIPSIRNPKDTLKPTALAIVHSESLQAESIKRQSGLTSSDVEDPHLLSSDRREGSDFRKWTKYFLNTVVVLLHFPTKGLGWFRTRWHHYKYPSE